MSFESEIKKLQKLWDNGENNQNSIFDSQSIQFTKQQQIDDINSPQFTTKILQDIGGDYIPISSFMTYPYLVSGFKWKIVLTLPESWVPLIDITIGYNYTGLTTDFNNISTYYNKVINISPTTIGSNLVIATWNIGLFLVSYNPNNTIPDFSAKLYFTLIDPSNAQ